MADTAPPFPMLAAFPYLAEDEPGVPRQVASAKMGMTQVTGDDVTGDGVSAFDHGACTTRVRAV